MRVLVSGSHGLIGSALVQALLGDGHLVTRLVRAAPGPDDVHWEPSAGLVDAAALEGHDAAVHLGGVGIGDRRWSAAHKTAVLESRVKGTRLLARTLTGLDRPPAVLASASAIGWYGSRGDEELTEASSPGVGFLAEVCRQWEASTEPAEAAGIRVAHLRTGVVLSRRGGALARMLLPFRLGLGGRLGSGRQWTSWIDLDDEVGAIRHVLTQDRVRGAVNLTAPEPVTNADFVAALGRALHRPAVLPTPTLALRAVFGFELVDEVLLASQRALPAALQVSGYQFRFPDLEASLRHALS